MGVSAERRIHEAIRMGKGIRLTNDELWDFVVRDDAIATRITNRAALDHGNEEPGNQQVGMWSMTWRELGRMSSDTQSSRKDKK